MEFRWEQLSGRGTVVSWCTFEKRYYEELPVPWDVILVELAEGPLFVSNPFGFDSSDVAFGLPLHVTFISAEDDAGPFRLPVFQKAVEPGPAPDAQVTTTPTPELQEGAAIARG
jgi:uncharacterized OB-fold protein